MQEPGTALHTAQDNYQAGFHDPEPRTSQQPKSSHAYDNANEKEGEIIKTPEVVNIAKDPRTIPADPRRDYPYRRTILDPDLHGALVTYAHSTR